MEGVLTTMLEMCKNFAIPFVCYVVEKSGDGYIPDTTETHILLHMAALLVKHGNHIKNQFENIVIPEQKPAKNFEKEFAVFMEQSLEKIGQHTKQDPCTHCEQLWQKIQQKYPLNQVCNRADFVQTLAKIEQDGENLHVFLPFPTEKDALTIFTEEYENAVIQIRQKFPTITEMNDYFFVMEFFDNETETKKIEFTFKNTSHNPEISTLIGLFSANQ